MTGQLVFATVGTDHHPFDRLVGWLDQLAENRRDSLCVVVQHGHTAAPQVAEGHAFLGHESLSHLIESADVVVCHGGPGTIMDAHRASQLPVVVPRDPAYAEHVDGHQIRFTSRVAETGLIEVVRDNDLFMRTLEHRLDRLAAPHRAAAPKLPEQRQPSGLGEIAEELDEVATRDVNRRDSLLRAARQVMRL